MVSHVHHRVGCVNLHDTIRFINNKTVEHFLFTEEMKEQRHDRATLKNCGMSKNKEIREIRETTQKWP